MSDRPTNRQSLTDLTTRRKNGLRINSAAVAIAIFVQYGLGVGVSLYIEVPKADRGSGPATALGRALTSSPAALAAHVALGLLILLGAIIVLVRAIRTRHPIAIGASVLGLLAILAAVGSGASMVNKDQTGVSMSHAVLVGVALLCYLVNLFVLGGGAARRTTHSPAR
jgi:hypothetical protein